ncbi:MAG: response regulator [Cyanobacteria bacterium P01_E01_bin.6]
MSTDYIRYRILLVDDEINNRRLIVRLLRGLDYDLQDVSNGKEAIQAWKDWQPHLILMDMRMPVMNGYVATQQIRNLEQEQHDNHVSTAKTTNYPPHRTKIIATTANAFEEEQSRIIEAGCDDIIHKPFRVEQLRRSIEHHLQYFNTPENQIMS